MRCYGSGIDRVTIWRYRFVCPRCNVACTTERRYQVPRPFIHCFPCLVETLTLYRMKFVNVEELKEETRP
jgi:hypothetical protein